MKDAEDTRVMPKTWHEYLRESQEIFKVGRWMWREIVDATARRRVKQMLVLSGAAVLLGLAQPWMVRHIIDGLAGRNRLLIVWGFVGMVFCIALQKILHHFEGIAREWIVGQNMGELDRRITEMFFEKSMGQHLQESSSLTVANIDKGRWRALEMQSMLFFEGIPTLLSLLLSFVMLWLLSVVAGAMMTVVVLTYLAWMLYLNQQVVEKCTPIEKDFRLLNRHRLERWDKIERVKTCGKESEESQEMNRWWDRMISNDRGFWFWYIASCSKRSLVNLAAMLLIMGYGAWLVWRREWPIGLLFPLFSWTAGLTENLWRIGSVEHKLNWNMPSVRAMISALTIRPDVWFSPDSPVIQYTEPIKVVFDGVSHNYPTGSSEDGEAASKSAVPTIKDVSFTIEPGEKVALMGPSGAGKTTIMRLLLRYMDPDTGCIRVNGYTLPQVNLSAWMRLVGYIPQQAQILDGTVRYNLTYGLTAEEQSRISDDELWQTMRLLKIDFGERLTDGLETVVGRNGVKLSGGQAQRLMIGAAVLKRPILMVIDEATSSLDSTTEKEVHDGLAQILGGRMSALIVTHRLSTVRDLCHKFIVLKNAADLIDDEPQIEAVGVSFEDLFAKSPSFRQLAKDQGIANVA